MQLPREPPPDAPNRTEVYIGRMKVGENFYEVNWRYQHASFVHRYQLRCSELSEIGEVIKTLLKAGCLPEDIRVLKVEVVPFEIQHVIKVSP